jgi:hypothetical protein
LTTETTAKTLDAAIGFLALYEDIQEDIYKEILALISNDGKLVRIVTFNFASSEREQHFKDLPRLTKVQSCFLEAARLFRKQPLHLLEVTFKRTSKPLDLELTDMSRSQWLSKRTKKMATADRSFLNLVQGFSLISSVFVGRFLIL